MTEPPGDESLQQGQAAGGQSDSQTGNIEAAPGSQPADPVSGPASGEAPKTPNLPPHLAGLVKVTQKTARTMLDHSVLSEVVAKTAAKEEIKAVEQMKAKANEPVKPFEPIANYKMATPCSQMWEGTDPRERYRYCEKCHLQVYDFTGMELPEAEALIFKRESRKNAPLFKRADGKFLTADCPVGVGNKRNLILSIVGGTLLVVSVLVVLMMMPHPKPTVSTDQSGSSGGEQSSTVVKVDTSKAGVSSTVRPIQVPTDVTSGPPVSDTAADQSLYATTPLINAPQAPVDDQNPEWTDPAVTPAPQSQAPAATPAQPAATPAQQAATPAPQTTEPSDASAQPADTQDLAPAEPAAPAPASSGVNYYPPSSAPSSR